MQANKLVNPPNAYLYAKFESPTSGIGASLRPEPNLDQARTELSDAISRVATLLFRDKYGPLLSAVSQPAINEFLKSLESNLSRTKGDFTLVFEELFDRMVSKNLRKGN
jgi:hypothetical protein